MRKSHSSVGTMSPCGYILSTSTMPARDNILVGGRGKSVFFHIDPAFGIGAASSAT